jgi:hypothetical protein
MALDGKGVQRTIQVKMRSVERESRVLWNSSLIPRLSFD